MFLKLFILILPIISLASYDQAKGIYSTKKNRVLKNYEMVQALADDNLYYSSVPFIKDSLYKVSQFGENWNKLVDDTVLKVGIKQFEVLPISILQKSKSKSIHFIIGKKLFRQKKWAKARSYLADVQSSEFSPFARMLEASMLTLEKKNVEAISKFSECVSQSGKYQNDRYGNNYLMQLEFNRDSCILGRARAYYADKKYKEAELAYLDLSKSSFQWPEILYEEAWTSFYKKDYNRTLGKLVTYKSPFLNYIYNPEIDVLQSLTFLNMCLYKDARHVAEDFYKKNLKPAKRVRGILRSKKKDYKFYFNEALRQSKKTAFKGHFEKMLNSVTREPSYKSLMTNFKKAMDEYKRVKKMPNSSFKRRLIGNLSETLKLQRDVAGAFVRTSLLRKYTRLFKAFQQMSYIKLEILDHRKRELYTPSDEGGRGRGDLRYINRNEKQYFWTFNGEFWADELGDYVFALKSEC